MGTPQSGHFFALRFWGIAAPFLHGRPCSEHVWTPETLPEETVARRGCAASPQGWDEAGQLYLSWLPAL